MCQTWVRSPSNTSLPISPQNMVMTIYCYAIIVSFSKFNQNIVIAVLESRTRSPPPPTWSAWHSLAPTTILIPLCNASNLRARDCPPRTCILAAWNVSRIAQWMSKFNLKLVLGQENFAVFTLNCARLQGEQGNHVQGKRIHKGEVPGQEGFKTELGLKFAV